MSTWKCVGYLGMIGCLLAAFAGGAIAEPITFTLERLSDTEARLTASGTVPSDFFTEDGGTSLVDLSGVIDGSATAITGDLDTDTLVVGYDATAYGVKEVLLSILGEDVQVGFDGQYSNEWTFQGSLSLTLTGGQWAAVGSSGDLLPSDLGSWRMVNPVPEPSSLALTGLALAGAAAWRRRRSRRTAVV